MGNLDEFQMMVLRDFLGEHWSLFVSHCEHHGEDVADEIYVALGGEPE